MRKSNQEIKDNISESIRKIRCTAINLAEEEHQPSPKNNKNRDIPGSRFGKNNTVDT